METNNINNTNSNTKVKRRRRNNNKKKKQKSVLKNTGKMIATLFKKTKNYMNKFFNPINNRIKDPRYFDSVHAHQFLEYIEGVLDPQIAVESGRVIRQPSTMPIWSTTLSFKNRFTFSPDSNGEFYLCWNPNYLYHFDGNLSFKYNNTNHQYTGIGRLFQRVGNNLICKAGYTPPVDTSKYRLVGAKIQVSYIGPAIQKSGMFYACAAYNEAPILFTQDANGDSNYVYLNASSATDPLDFSTIAGVPDGYLSPLYNAWSKMNIATISNGIWSKTLNVQNTKQSINCIHIPIDPTSHIFQPTGSYFGESIPTGDTFMNPTYNAPAYYPPAMPVKIVDGSCEGTQICYFIAGTGLPNVSKCINVTIYYNFEIIPTASTASFLHGCNENRINEFDANLASQVVEQVTPTNSIQVQTAPTHLSRSQKLIKTLSNIGDKINRSFEIASSIASVLNRTKNFLP